MRPLKRVLLSVCAASGFACLVSCGDDADRAVPFADIPRDKRLTELTPEEQRGACEWAAAIGLDKLPKAGTKLDCDGLSLTFNGPAPCKPKALPAECTATVAQWEVCLPRFVDRLAEDPCLILDLGLSQTRLEEFVNAIPGCEGHGPCAYTVP